MNNTDVPIWEKYTLTIEEASKDVYKRQLYNHIADIVHGTVGSVTSVIPADIIVLFSRFISFAMESQLTSAIRTVEQAGEHGHFPHPGWASFSGTDFLDDLKGFFVNDSLMGIFKDFPLIGAVAVSYTHL